MGSVGGVDNSTNCRPSNEAAKKVYVARVTTWIRAVRQNPFIIGHHTISSFNEGHVDLSKFTDGQVHFKMKCNGVGVIRTFRNNNFDTFHEEYLV